MEVGGLNAWKAVRGWGWRVVGGRYSRGAFAITAIGLVAAVGLLVVPLSTFLWTSPQALRDIYMWSAIAVILACLLAFALVFAKRLHDQNINGLWAILILVALPVALFSGAQAWVGSLPVEQQGPPTSDTIYVAAELAWAAVVLVLAFRAPRLAERYGTRTEARAVLTPRHPVPILVLSVIAVVVAVSLYAGFFQDGLWVHRPEYSFYSGPAITPPGGGNVFAHCGNAKGVSAYAQKGGSGFVRDAVGGTWSLVVLPDGTLDIQTFSERQVLSYRQDGFTVTATGLRMTSYGSLTKDVDHFMIVARASGDTAENVTVMSFARREYGYLALISSTRLMGKGSLLAGDNGARASSFLVMADCTVDQEYEVKPSG